MGGTIPHREGHETTWKKELTMQEQDLSAGIQYTIDQHGHVTAIVVTPEVWERIMELLAEAEQEWA